MEARLNVGSRAFRDLTCSAGVAELGGPSNAAEITESVDQLYHQLCNGLYKAKEHGGDAVIVSPKA